MTIMMTDVLQQQAAADAADHFVDRAIRLLDDRFGDGYARENPRLVTAYVQTASHALAHLRDVERRREREEQRRSTTAVDPE